MTPRDAVPFIGRQVTNLDPSDEAGRSARYLVSPPDTAKSPHSDHTNGVRIHTTMELASSAWL
jgi:hypothetical protein